MHIKPLRDYVLVKILSNIEKTKGGIVLPETAKEKPIEGKVVAVGPGKVLENGLKQPCEVKVNDIVIFSKYSGNEIEIDNEKYLIFNERDILAVKE